MRASQTRLRLRKRCWDAQLSQSFKQHLAMHETVLTESRAVLEELNKLQDESTAMACQLEKERAASTSLSLQLEECQNLHAAEIQKRDHDLLLLRVRRACGWSFYIEENALFILYESVWAGRGLLHGIDVLLKLSFNSVCIIAEPLFFFKTVDIWLEFWT